MTHAAQQLLRNFETLAVEDQRELLAELLRVPTGSGTWAPESEEDFLLTEAQQEELSQALAEADRGEGVDGWQFLAELRRS